MSFASLLSSYAKKEVKDENSIHKSSSKKHHFYHVLEAIKNKSHSRPFIESTSFNGPKNLYILFIVIDDFPNELLWRLWSKDEESIKFMFHAKFPDRVKSPWVRERLVKSFHFKPQWGSIEITKVMVYMLREALMADPNMNKFCFASESCVPIVPVKKCLDEIYSSDDAEVDGCCSWLQYFNKPNNGYAKQKQFEVLKKMIPETNIFKADQWFLLSRTHAVGVINLINSFQSFKDEQPSKTSEKSNKSHDGKLNPDDNIEVKNPEESIKNQFFLLFSHNIFNIFSKTTASDELFFPCCLSLLGFLESESSVEPSTELSEECSLLLGCVELIFKKEGKVIKRCLTYSNWEDNGANPKTYFEFPKNEKIALESGCLFFRKIKFPKNYSVGETKGLTSEQDKFLRNWIIYALSFNNTSDSDLLNGKNSAINIEEHNEMIEKYLSDAYELLVKIKEESETIYEKNFQVDKDNKNNKSRNYDSRDRNQNKRNYSDYSKNSKDDDEYNEKKCRRNDYSRAGRNHKHARNERGYNDSERFNRNSRRYDRYEDDSNS